MTDEEWQHLYENFETTELLSAVDAVDSLRDDLNDGECFRPPELRTNLLKLHELAMAVVNNGSRSQASKMFDLAMDLALGWDVHEHVACHMREAGEAAIGGEALLRAVVHLGRPGRRKVAR